MQRIQATLVATLASLGLAFASGAALAQKGGDAPKDSTKATTTSAPKADAKKTDAKKAEAPKAETAKKSEPMDINSASEKELATLKGIGDVRAAAIVKHRPYKGKDDLVKKKIVPQKVYDEIKDEIIAKQDTAAAPKKK
jgi:competence protein ComEA